MFLAGKLIQMIPYIFGFSPLDKRVCPIGIDMIGEPSVAQLRTGFANRQQFRRPMRVPQTHALQRALGAVIAQHRRALECTELHDGGVEEPRVFAVQECLYVLMEEFLPARCIERFVDIQ